MRVSHDTSNFDPKDRREITFGFVASISFVFRVVGFKGTPKGQQPFWRGPLNTDTPMLVQET